MPRVTTDGEVPRNGLCYQIRCRHDDPCFIGVEQYINLLAPTFSFPCLTTSQDSVELGLASLITLELIWELCWVQCLFCTSVCRIAHRTVVGSSQGHLFRKCDVYQTSVLLFNLHSRVLVLKALWFVFRRVLRCVLDASRRVEDVSQNVLLHVISRLSTRTRYIDLAVSPHRFLVVAFKHLCLSHVSPLQTLHALPQASMLTTDTSRRDAHQD